MKLFISITVLAILLLIGSSLWSKNTKEKAWVQNITGVVSTIVTDRNHVQTKVNYDTTPSVGGDHHPVWLGCNGDVYEEPVVEENAVHSLEHGAVWITYQPSITGEQFTMLDDKMAGYSFLSPYPEQDSPIMLTAWGVQLSVDSANDPRIDQFLTKYRQGPQTPEPGATCNAIPGGM